MKVAIAGGCRCGKTTAAKRWYRGIVRHTDDAARTDDWDSAAATIAGWFDQPFDCIEGVTVARALRHWLRSHPSGKPCDLLIVLLDPYTPLTPAQQAMNKGIATVLGEIYSTLVDRGVSVSGSIRTPE